MRTVAVKMFLFLVTNPRCIESTAPQELSHACRNAVRRGKRVAETAALSSIAMSPLVTSLPAGLAAAVSPAASVGIEPTAADWVGDRSAKLVVMIQRPHIA